MVFPRWSMLTASKFRPSGSQSRLCPLLDARASPLGRSRHDTCHSGILRSLVHFDEQGNTYVDHGRSSPMIIASLQRMQHAKACIRQAFRLYHSPLLTATPSTRGRHKRCSTPVRWDEQQTVRQNQPLSRSCKCLCTASEKTAAGGRRLFLYSKSDCPLCDGYKVASFTSSAAH